MVVLIPRILVKPLLMVACFILWPYLFRELITQHGQHHQFLSKGATTEASIIDAYETGTGSYRRFYLSYTYNIKGKMYSENDVQVFSKKLFDSYLSNNKVKIYYLPDEPDKNMAVDEYDYKENWRLGLVMVPLLWATMLGFMWHPLNKREHRNDPDAIIYNVRHILMYHLIVLIITGARLIFISVDAILPFLPIGIFISASILSSMLWIEKKHLKVHVGMKKNKFMELVFPIYLAVFILGIVLLSEWENGAVFLGYTIVACIFAMFLSDIPDWIAKYKRQRHKARLLAR